MSTPAAPPPQRRQVTVLFLDIASSTRLVGQLDLEDVLKVVDVALRRFSAIVAAAAAESCSTRVTACWPRSARCARWKTRPRAGGARRPEPLAAARDYAASVQRERGFSGFGIHVGIHIGAVLLGGGVDEASTIRGYTVNIAARLEQSTPTGALRSQEIWRQKRLGCSAINFCIRSTHDGPVADVTAAKRSLERAGPEAVGGGWVHSTHSGPSS